MGVGGIRPCKTGSGRESEDTKREAVGLKLQIRWEQSIDAHLHGPFCASWALPVCFGELWTPVPPLHPGCPLEGIPSPGVHFGGYSHPLACSVPCPGPSAAFGCPWLCLLGLLTALKESSGVSLSMGFSVSQSPGCAIGLLCTPQCV